MKFSVDENRPIDLICMGRVAVDLYAEQIHSRLADAQTMRKYLGGCAGNIAVGTARLGLNTAMFSCVGDDEMGIFIRHTLQREKVNTELLYATPNHLTALVLLGVSPPNHFPLMFYRNDCADMQLKPEHVNESLFEKSKAILFTGTGISTPSMQAATLAALTTAKKTATRIIFDLDYRPVLWGLTAQGDGETRFIANQSVSNQYKRFIPWCDLIVGTEEEICIAAGMNEIADAISHLQMLTDIPIVLKTGAKGCQIFLTDSSTVTSKAFPVDILNVLGAGDAFMSGLLRGLLRGESWEQAATYANAAGALVVTRHGCAPAIPFWQELIYFITAYDTDPLAWQHENLKLLHSQFSLNLLCDQTQACKIYEENKIETLDANKHTLYYITYTFNEINAYEKLRQWPSMLGVHIKLDDIECDASLKKLNLLSNICRQLERRLLIELDATSLSSLRKQIQMMNHVNIFPFAWLLNQMSLLNTATELNVLAEALLPANFYLSFPLCHKFNYPPNFLGYIESTTSFTKEVA